MVDRDLIASCDVTLTKNLLTLQSKLRAIYKTATKASKGEGYNHLPPRKTPSRTIMHRQPSMHDAALDWPQPLRMG